MPFASTHVLNPAYAGQKPDIAPKEEKKPSRGRRKKAEPKVEEPATQDESPAEEVVEPAAAKEEDLSGE